MRKVDQAEAYQRHEGRPTAVLNKATLLSPADNSMQSQQALFILEHVGRLGMDAERSTYGCHAEAHASDAEFDVLAALATDELYAQRECQLHMVNVSVTTGSATMRALAVLAIEAELDRRRALEARRS